MSSRKTPTPWKVCRQSANVRSSLMCGGVVSYPEWKCEAVRKIRFRKHLFHLFLWESRPLSCTSWAHLQANCKSARIRKLSSWGQMELPCWLWHLKSTLALQCPPSFGRGGLCVTFSALLSPWWLSWTLHGSLTGNMTPLNYFDCLVFKTSVFLLSAAQMSLCFKVYGLTSSLTLGLPLLLLREHLLHNILSPPNASPTLCVFLCEYCLCILNIQLFIHI